MQPPPWDDGESDQKIAVRPILAIAALVGISTLALAQNMGGAGSPGMPGMPPSGTIPAMHPGSGMNGAAVAGAMGGVAAGAGVKDVLAEGAGCLMTSHS